MSSIRELALAKAIGGGGGGGDITVEALTATENKKYTAPSGKAYSPVNVSVPNSYTQADECKVVNEGALVAQTAHAEVTENGTIDTTLNNSVVVNVSGGISGVTFSTLDPTPQQGSDGEYWYKYITYIGAVDYDTLAYGQGYRNAGFQFVCVNDLDVYGVRAKFKNTGDFTVGISEVAESNAEIERLNSTQIAVSTTGWNYALFDNPVHLQSGKRYTVFVMGSIDVVVYGTNSFSEITGHTISAISPIKGVFAQNANLFPANSGSRWFAVDILWDNGIRNITNQYYKSNGEWENVI